MRICNKTNLKKIQIYLKKHGLMKTVKKLVGKVLQLFVDPYFLWYKKNRPQKEELLKQKEESRNFDYRPVVSIVVPTYHTPTKFLREMIESVLIQSYEKWELCIGDGSEGNESLEQILSEYARKDKRVVYRILAKNLGISGNTNAALEMATGEYIALLDHDDLLAPNALYEIVKSLQEQKYDILYTDEDKISKNTKRHMEPNFKPDYSVDLFRSHNYITHFFLVKKEVQEKAGIFREAFDGAQDYDFMFRCIEKSESIKHIHKILYHWRMHEKSTAQNPHSKNYAYEAGRKAIEEHYKRIGVKAVVKYTESPGLYHTVYDLKNSPLVSIIIPNMNHVEDLKNCVDSLYQKNKYQNIEIIIVENNSTKKDIFEYYQKMQDTHSNFKVVTWKGEFNYAAINNFAVKAASAEYLLFLNNDTEVIEENAISEMLGCCMREEVSIVGAKLLYKNRTVQHAGVIIGIAGFAGHAFDSIDEASTGFMMRAIINGNYSAVTAACMMVKKSCFLEVGGFCEEFKVGLNDIDFCLRVRELNKLVVYNAFSLWFHYESKSRGYEDTPEKQKRFEREISLFKLKWKKILEQGDPYYNQNLSTDKRPFTL